MNHQVQGMVLIDNEWVSRPVDVYQIMAQAPQDDTETREPTVQPNLHVPGYGFLSRTVLPSPLFKFILPANIRHKDLNDIVSAGEDSIKLHEIHSYGRLRHVATRSNFSGRIIKAGVFGDAREVHVNRSAGSPLPKKQTVHRDRRSMTGSEDRVLPPEVVVLTLTSRTLMFLWAQQDVRGASVFRQKTIKLPAGSSRFDRLGQYLAIDPQRRAMAVSAYEGRFMLYKTKSMQTWRRELQHDKDTTPIEDERIIAIEGRIMHMEFLSSAATRDEYHVVLLFIIVHQGVTKLTCFDWDCRYDLSTASARTERVSVDLDDQSPSLLIPLRRSPDFLLVYDRHISVYKDVLSGAPQRTAVPIPSHILPPLRPGDSPHHPQWVQWDTTPRNPDFPKETFYIAREDGRVMYAEQGPAGAVDMDDAGEWPYRIDTAFACLNVDNSEFSQSYPDVLMAGAPGNDGLLCKVGAWPTEYSYATQYPTMNQFTYVESIPNWSPLTGLCVTQLPGIRGPYERERSALFVCNGAAPHGQLSELRVGLQALIDGSFSGMNGCSGLWIIHYGSQTVELEGRRARQHYALIIVTLPLETILLRLVRTQPESRGEFSGAWDDGVWDVTQLPTESEPNDDGITRNEETISACMFSDHFSVQITRRDVQTLSRPTLAMNDRIEFGSSILLAASKPGFSFVVTTFRNDGKTHVNITPILKNGTFDRQERDEHLHLLSADPTCIELFQVGGHSYVLIGTLDSKVTLFRVGPDHGMAKVLDCSLESSDADLARKLCESAVLLTSGECQILVCATRDGYLLSRYLFGLDTDSLPTLPEGSNVSFGLSKNSAWRVTKMGLTSVQIYPCSTDSTTAFVSCGSDFCKIRCSAIEPCNLDIGSVWFTDRTDPGYLQCPITAAHQLPFIGETDGVQERNLGGFLFVVSGDQMLYTQLDADVKWTRYDSDSRAEDELKAVPRKLITGAKPTHAVYLTAPRRMIVATTKATEEGSSPNRHRLISSTLSLLNVHDDKALDEVEVKQEVDVELASRLVVAQFSLKHAERVYSIVDWAFEDDRGKKYNLVIVGTGIATGPGKETGRRLIFNLGSRGSKLALQKESTYHHPLYCIALFDNRATVSVIGKLLSFDEFDVSSGRWFNCGSRELPSPGIYITVLGSKVFVSTLQHSHLCYEVTRKDGYQAVDFEQLFTDSRERSCTHHLVLQHGDIQQTPTNKQEALVLLTDKRSATISGLYHSGERSFKHASTTLFEACLPRTVVRLQRGDIRPPWRRSARYHKLANTIDGVLLDDLTGACSDGTIYAFSILSEPARHVLRLLQNLIENKQSRNPANRFSIVRHKSGDIFDVLMNGADGAQDCAIRARDIDPRYKGRGAAASRSHHIDGDLLLEFFDEGGDIRGLLSTDTEEDVLALFVELGGALLFQGRHNLRQGHLNFDDTVAGIQEWVSEVLMPLL